MMETVKTFETITILIALSSFFSTVIICKLFWILEFIVFYL
jgi:hypothetical protein